MDILKYKGYEGTADLDMERKVCRGKVLFINDLVTYQAASPADLQAEFESAVNDYIDTCAVLGREPQRPLQGVFQVRVSPELHKAAAIRATVDKVKLNDVVVRALDAFLNVRNDVTNNVHVTLQIPEGVMQSLPSTVGEPQWGGGYVRH